jgi:hypothetical protein
VFTGSGRRTRGFFSFLDGRKAAEQFIRGGPNVSHIVQIQTELRDAAAIGAACRRLALGEPVFGEAELFSGSKTGWQVQLPDWRYPVCTSGIATGGKAGSSASTNRNKRTISCARSKPSSSGDPMTKTLGLR